MRWMTQALQCSVRLLLTFWGHFRRRIICFWSFQPWNVDGWMSGTDKVNGWGNIIFLDCSWWPITDTSKSKAWVMGGLLICAPALAGCLSPLQHASALWIPREPQLSCFHGNCTSVYQNLIPLYHVTYSSQSCKHWFWVNILATFLDLITV